MTRIVGLASLYEPLEFLETKIRNFNQCDMTDVLIYWSDCSSEATWRTVECIIRRECHFNFRLDHHDSRTTLYWTWNWIIENTRSEATYYCNTNVDDLLNPEYFRKMSFFLDTRPGVHILACPWLITSIKGQQWPPQHDNSSIPNTIQTLGHFPMWRASLHDSVGMFNPLMKAIGDAEFWHRIKKKLGDNVIDVHPEFLACFLSHNRNLFKITNQATDWAMMPRETRS